VTKVLCALVQAFDVLEVGASVSVDAVVVRVALTETHVIFPLNQINFSQNQLIRPPTRILGCNLGTLS
jgi:hypothetical protein